MTSSFNLNKLSNGFAIVPCTESILVMPIFRIEHCLIPFKYRPVTPILRLCNILEYALLSHIINHPERNHILCENQHEFQKDDQLNHQRNNWQEINWCIFFNFSKTYRKLFNKRPLLQPFYYKIRWNMSNLIPNVLMVLVEEHVPWQLDQKLLRTQF